MKNKLSLFLALSLIILAISPFIGGHLISFSEILSEKNETTSYIFWQLRLPRVLLGALAGGTLAFCGMIFQGLFRNPLATPYTLGIASGASFTTSLFIILGLANTSFELTSYALIGALGASFIVYLLSHSKKRFSSNSMLLAGVAINFFFSSLMLLLQYFSEVQQSYQIIRWLMGGLEIISYSSFYVIVPCLVFGLSLSSIMLKSLNLLSIDQELAQSRGVNVVRTQKYLFFSTSLLVAVIVAHCGPIPFVGMMIPHICRLLVGANNLRLAPIVVVLGAGFLVACDTFARTVIAPAEIPVGVITALLGGPFFLWLLLRHEE